jgi:hypothetical protein
MTITVANFITQYARPSLPNATDWTDAVIGYWIDAALLDISRSFPRKTYAMWGATAGTYAYAYADSTTVADETTIIRILNCLYPYNSTNKTGPAMSRKNHIDQDFLGGPYYEADSDAQILYIGASLTTALDIYCDAHIYWKTATAVIINPAEHWELINLFCVWQAFLHQLADITSSPVPDGSLYSVTALEVHRAEIAYRDAYQKLAESKATSVYTPGWTLDKWDRNLRPDIGDVDRVYPVEV